MIKPLVTRFLQHLTAQNHWSKPYLTPFAGKVVQFDFVLAKTNLQILEDGSLAAAAESAAPGASIHLPPSLALRLLAGDENAKSHIKIDGDTYLAAEFSKVFQKMHWDVEDDLSKVVGDIAAYKIGKVSKNAFTEAKKQTINAAEMLSEFWQEEKLILAKKRHVERFNADVDILRSDVERFEKRLGKRYKKLKESTLN